MRVQYHYFALVIIVLSSFVILASKPTNSFQNESKQAISANLVYGDYSKFTFIVKNTSNKVAEIKEIKIGNEESSYNLTFDVMDLDRSVKYSVIPKKTEARLVVNFVDSKNTKVDCPESIEKVYIKMKIGDETLVMSSYKILICDKELSQVTVAKK